MKFLICSIIKDEHQTLKEWIEHHLSIGFTEIHLFEDFSSKSHLQITQNYPEVTLTKVDDYFKVKRDYDIGNMRQCRLYQKFLNLHKEGWCAFIDLDEFVFLADELTLDDIANEYNDCTGLSMIWKMKGATGHVLPAESVVQEYTQDTDFAESDRFWWMYKSFVNLNIAKEFDNLHNIHGIVTEKRTVPRQNQEPISVEQADVFAQKIWLHHYFTKSFYDWVQRFKRGDLMPNNRKFNTFFELNTDFEKVHHQFGEFYVNKEDDFDKLVKVKEEADHLSIPKVIHYCWFGGSELPDYAKHCIDSWKRHMPDYEIKRWDESNFDVNSHPFVKAAYDDHNYAFVSDYVRNYSVYTEGGIYFDIDVELIKSIDDIVQNGPFMGYEVPKSNNWSNVAEGLGFAAEAGNPYIRDILDMYDKMQYKMNSDSAFYTKGIVGIMTDYLSEKSLYHAQLKGNNQIQQIGNITIYPSEYFCPIAYHSNKLTITENTRSIHWYTASWGKYVANNRIDVKKSQQHEYPIGTIEL